MQTPLKFAGAPCVIIKPVIIIVTDHHDVDDEGTYVLSVFVYL